MVAYSGSLRLCRETFRGGCIDESGSTILVALKERGARTQVYEEASILDASEPDRIDVSDDTKRRGRNGTFGLRHKYIDQLQFTAQQITALTQIAAQQSSA